MGVDISALYRYPVKSCAGTKADTLTLSSFGVDLDRSWMIVDENGIGLTQRQNAKLALIFPSISKGSLILHAEGQTDLSIPLGGARDECRVRVFKGEDVCRAYDEGKDVARWLKSFLGVSCRLVRKAAADRRAGKSAAGRRVELDFQDQCSVLVISEKSFSSLQSRARRIPFTMEHFRPNIVLGGCTRSHEEDRWKEMKVEHKHTTTILTGELRCQRCSIVCVNQETGERMGPRLLEVLARLRNLHINPYDSGSKKRPVFGRYFSTKGSATLSVGERVST